MFPSPRRWLFCWASSPPTAPTPSAPSRFWETPRATISSAGTARGEADYEAYLASITEDDAAPGQGATLLDMVDEKERLLRARGLDDLFAGMKAEENAVAAAVFPAVVEEIDDAWEPEPGAAKTFPDPNAAKAEMLRTVLECCLAGNLFDAGAAAAVRASPTPTPTEP